MTQLSTKSVLHSRLSKFVTWVSPEDETEEDITTQSEEIRQRITSRAVDDGLIVMSSPFSGSFAKKTGLRRYYRGDAVQEGQDIDIAFIVKPEDKNGKKLEELIDRFYKYADGAYPKTDKRKTKSSVELNFTGTGLSYDIVPLLHDGKDRQILIRTTGEKRITSVNCHTEFITKRSNASNQLKGIVKFNECVRLIKWWRTVQQEESGVFGNGDNDKKVPSFLLDLLCAKAYDERKVQTTWAATLLEWFGYLANQVKTRNTILFEDYVKNPKTTAGIAWTVADPVNPSVNIVQNWQPYMVDELANWLAKARDAMARAIRYDDEGDDTASMEQLIKLFGSSFKNNCE